MRLYGVDVGTVPTAELDDMIMCMPPGTRTLSLYCPAAAWSSTEYILAEVFDVLDVIAHGKVLKGDPSRYPRPGAKMRRKEKSVLKTMPVGELHAFFERGGDA